MDNQGVFVIVIVIVTVIVSVTAIVTVIVIVIVIVAVIVIVTVIVNFDGNPPACLMISPGNCPGGSFRTIAGEAIVQEAASGQLPGI